MIDIGLNQFPMKTLITVMTFSRIHGSMVGKSTDFIHQWLGLMV